MRTAVGRLGIVATAFVAASCAATADARVESTAAVPPRRPVPGTEVSLAVPDGFALDEKAQTVSCSQTSVCGDTRLYIAWRTASATRDPGELFAEELEGQLRSGHSLTNVRIGGVDAVRLDAAPDTVNPGEVMRDYRLRVDARTVRFHPEGHSDHVDAVEALGRSVEDAVLLPAAAPIDRGWSLDDALGLQVQESSPDYTFVGDGERPNADEPGLAVAYGCYADTGDAGAGDDRHREMTAQYLRADGVEVTSMATVDVDGLAAIEAEGRPVGATGRGRWAMIVFRADRPLVISTELDLAGGAAPLDRLRTIVAGLRMTGPASITACA